MSPMPIHAARLSAPHSLVGGGFLTVQGAAVQILTGVSCPLGLSPRRKLG